jgi:hypothetical protein
MENTRQVLETPDSQLLRLTAHSGNMNNGECNFQEISSTNLLNDEASACQPFAQ